MSIADGIKLFNDGKYFEAHDHFEKMWINSTGDDKNFYQALTQISVGFYHLTSGNYEGAKSQLQKGKEKLAYYSKTIYNINVEEFILNLSITIEMLYNFNMKGSNLKNLIPIINGFY